MIDPRDEEVKLGAIFNGAAYDFVCWLVASNHPIVVGGEYSARPILMALDAWMAERNLTQWDVKQDTFRRLVQPEKFK